MKHLSTFAPHIAFILGALVFIWGLGVSNTGCFGPDGCLYYFLGIGFPINAFGTALILAGTDLIVFSLFFIVRGSHKAPNVATRTSLGSKISLLFAAAFVVVALYIPLSGQFFIPSYSDTGPAEILIFVALFLGVVLGVDGAVRLISKKRTTPNFPHQGLQPQKITSSAPSGRKEKVIVTSAAILSVLLISLTLVGVVNWQCIGGCTPYSPPMTLNSATLYSGPLPVVPTCQATNSACLVFAINNPGASTNVSGIVIQPNSSSATFSTYYVHGGTCTQISSKHEPSVGYKTIANLSVYFGEQTASILAKNQTVNYIIDFANSDSISGQLVAQ